MLDYEKKRASDRKRSARYRLRHLEARRKSERERKQKKANERRS